MEVEAKITPNNNTNTFSSGVISPNTKYSPNSKNSTKKPLHYESNHTLFYSTASSPMTKKNKHLLFSRSQGLSYSQSASTLQHSPVVWGFAKAERFHKIIPKKRWHFYDLPTTLNDKGTALGYGKKVVMSDVFLKQAYDVPPPSKYNLKPAINSDPHKGKTFGLSYSAYAKTYLPNMSMQTPEVAKKLPGPGEYKVDEDIGSNKRKTTIKSRVKWFYEEIKPQAPAANHYFPVTESIDPSRFKEITQGFGKRSNFLQVRTDTPGPGTYSLPSVFDKFEKNDQRQNKNLRPNTEHRRTQSVYEGLHGKYNDDGYANNEELFRTLSQNIFNEELNPFKQEVINNYKNDEENNNDNSMVQT